MQPLALALIAWPYIDHYTALAADVSSAVRIALHPLTPHGLAGFSTGGVGAPAPKTETANT